MPSAKLFVFFLQAVHPLFTEFKLVRPSFQTLHHLGYSSPLHRRPGQSEGVQNEARGPDVTRRVWAEGLLVPETAGRLQMHTRLFFNLKNPTIVVALCQCGVTNQKVHLGFYFSNSQQVRVRVSPSRGKQRCPPRSSCSYTCEDSSLESYVSLQNLSNKKRERKSVDVITHVPLQGRSGSLRSPLCSLAQLLAISSSRFLPL